MTPIRRARLLASLRAASCALALVSGAGRAQEAARGAASADEKSAAEALQKAQSAEAEKPKGRGAGAPARKVLRLDEFSVEGRIQKPQAFFILQRSNLNYDDGEKKESFLPKIVKSCEKDPF